MKYHERRITYDEKSQNFKIIVPELGLEVLSDTEMGALLEMRKEVTAAAKRPKLPPNSMPPEMPSYDKFIYNGDDITRAMPPIRYGCPQCGYPKARPPQCSHCGFR